MIELLVNNMSIYITQLRNLYLLNLPRKPIRTYFKRKKYIHRKITRINAKPILLYMVNNCNFS